MYSINGVLAGFGKDTVSVAFPGHWENTIPFRPVMQCDSGQRRDRCKERILKFHR